MILEEEIKLAKEMGLTSKFVIDAKLRAMEKDVEPYRTPRERVLLINRDIRHFIKCANNLKNLLFKHPKDSWLIHESINDCYNKIDKLNMKIALIKKPKKIDNKTFFDIARIKEIPLDTITEILPSGFFVNNPFREEKSPSNSLHWDKKANRFYDFGSGKNGDVIDLFMAINKCSMITALKALSGCG